MMFKNSKMSDMTPVNLASETNASSENNLQNITTELKSKEENNAMYPDVQALAPVACHLMEFPTKDSVIPSSSACGEDVTILQSDNSQISFNSSCSLDNTKLPKKKKKRARRTVFWRNKKRKSKKKSNNSQEKPINLFSKLTFNEKVDSDSSDTIILDDADFETNIQKSDKKSCNEHDEDEKCSYLGRLLPSKGMTPEMLACYISLPKVEGSSTQTPIPTQSHSCGNEQLGYEKYSNRSESEMFTIFEEKKSLSIKSEGDLCVQDDAPVLFPIKKEIDDSFCDIDNELPPILQHVSNGLKVISTEKENSSKSDAISCNNESPPVLSSPILQDSNGNLDCNITDKRQRGRRGKGKSNQVHGRVRGRKQSKSNVVTTETICSDAQFSNFSLPSEFEKVVDPSSVCKKVIEGSQSNFNNTVSKRRGKSKTVNAVQHTLQQELSSNILGKGSINNVGYGVQSGIRNFETEANKAFVFMSFEEDVTYNEDCEDEATHDLSIRKEDKIIPTFKKNVNKCTDYSSSIPINDKYQTTEFHTKQVKLQNAIKNASCSTNFDQKRKLNNNDFQVKTNCGTNFCNLNALKIKTEIIDSTDEEIVPKNKCEMNWNQHLSDTSSKTYEDNASKSNVHSFSPSLSNVNSSSKQLAHTNSLLGAHDTSSLSAGKLLDLGTSETFLSGSKKQIPVTLLNNIKIKKEIADDSENLFPASETSCILKPSALFKESSMGKIKEKLDVSPSESLIPDPSTISDCILEKHLDVGNKKSRVLEKFQEQKFMHNISNAEAFKLGKCFNSVSQSQNLKDAKSTNIYHTNLESQKEIGNIASLPSASNAACLPSSDASNKKDNENALSKFVIDTEIKKKAVKSVAPKSTNNKQSILCSLLMNAKSPSSNLPTESAVQKSVSDSFLPPIISIKKEPIDEEIPSDSSIFSSKVDSHHVSKMSSEDGACCSKTNEICATSGSSNLINQSSNSESISNEKPMAGKTANVHESTLGKSNSNLSLQNVQSCKRVEVLQQSAEVSLNRSSSSIFPVRIKQEPPDTDNASFEEAPTFNKDTLISNTGYQTSAAISGSNSQVDIFSSQQPVSNVHQVGKVSSATENVSNTLNSDHQNSASISENVSSNLNLLLPSTIQIKEEPLDEISTDVSLFSETSNNEDTSSVTEVASKTPENNNLHILKSNEHSQQILSDDSNSLLSTVIKKEPCDDVLAIEEISVFHKKTSISENKECSSSTACKIVSPSENISRVYQSDAESSSNKHSVTGCTNYNEDISDRINSKSDVVLLSPTENCKNDASKLNNIPYCSAASIISFTQPIESDLIKSPIQRNVDKSSDSIKNSAEISQLNCLPLKESNSLVISMFSEQSKESTSPSQNRTLMRTNKDECAMPEILSDENCVSGISTHIYKKESSKPIKNTGQVSSSVNTSDISFQYSSINDFVPIAQNIALLQGSSISYPKPLSEETKSDNLCSKKVPFDNCMNNLEKKCKYCFTYPFPADSLLGFHRRKHRCRSNLYTRVNPLSLNLSLEEVASRLHCAENKALNFQNEIEDIIKLTVYPLEEAEAECYHRILGIAPSQKLLSKCYKPSRIINLSDEKYPSVGFLPVCSSNMDNKCIPSLQNASKLNLYGKFFENFNPDEICEDSIKYSSPKQDDSVNLVDKREISDPFKNFSATNCGLEKNDFAAGLSDFKISESEKLNNLFSDLAEKFNSLTNNSIKVDNIDSRVSEVAYCTQESYMNLDACSMSDMSSIKVNNNNSNSFVSNLEVGTEDENLEPSTENEMQQDLQCANISKDMLYRIIQNTKLTSVDNFMLPDDQAEISAATPDNENTYSDSQSVVNNPVLPVTENSKELFDSNEIAACTNSLQIQDNTWPDSTMANKCLEKIDIPYAELLKIVQTAENLHSNVIQNNIASDTPNVTNYVHNEVNNSMDRMLLKNITLNYNNYDLNYSAVVDQTIHSKIPIIHEYDHKPARFSDDTGISNVTPNSVYCESAKKISNETVSDSENVSDNDYVDMDVYTRSEDEDDSKKQPSPDEKELPKSEPKYKSRWEKIMERKTFETESKGKRKVNEHLLKECFPVSETISSSKLCKKSTKTKLTNSFKKSNILELPKSLKRAKSEKTDLPACSEPKKMKRNKSKRSAKGNKSYKCATNKLMSLNTSSLFSPDKVIKKFDPRKAKKPDPKRNIETGEKCDGSAKRFYGNRVTNRGSFLTQSSVNQPPKFKKVQHKSIPKKNVPRIKTDEFHSMVQSPEIEIISDRTIPKSNVPRIRTNDQHQMAEPPETGIFRHRSVLNSSYEHTSQLSYEMQNIRSKPLSYPAYRQKVNYSDTVEPFYSSMNQATHTLSNSILNASSSNLPETFLPNRRKAQEIPSISNSSAVVNPLLKASTQFGAEQFIEGVNRYKNPSRLDPRLQPYNSRNTSISAEKVIDNLMPVFQSPPSNASPIDFGFDSPNLSSSHIVGAPFPLAITHATQSSQQQSARLKPSKCICLPPRHMKASVGEKLFETINVLLLILEWNVDWLVQQQRNHDPPPISNSVKKVKNSYENIEDYYNTYFPLLLLETWQRIYVSWTHLHQASPYFCEITSYTVETHSINVECKTVYKSSDVDRGIFPEEGNIIMVKFATVGKGGIKILGYVTHVKVKHFNPEVEPDNICYKALKYNAGDQLQLIKLSFKGAYSSEDFDKKQLIRIQVLCNIKSTLKQNDAMLNVKVSPLCANILNPLEDGLRTVTLAARHLQKAADKVSECVREIMKGILSPHPLPLLTVVKSLPSSDRLLILPQLIERMKSSYATKVLLCTRTTKALTDIGFNLEDSEVKVVIIGKRGDIHQKLRKYMLDDLAAADISAKSSELASESKAASTKEQSKVELLINTKKRIISECDVILSLIRNCHDELIVQACAECDHVAHMCCIIDEANLCTEPEILIPLLYGISKLILIGDPDIPAKVCSKTANSYDYNRSLFHRAYDLDLIED